LFSLALLALTNLSHGEMVKKSEFKIKRIPSSIEDDFIVLNGQHMARQIHALEMNEANTEISTASLLVENRASNICKYLGYKLVGYDEITLTDFGTRDPSPSVVIKSEDNFQESLVSKYYSFSRIFCEHVNPTDHNICELKTHGSSDVFFIKTRRKDTCK